MLSSYLAAYAVSLLYVGLRSFQQLNVMHSQYWWIPPVSMSMAFADYFVINQMVNHPWDIAIAIGAGGATGACLSVYWHAKLRARKEKAPQ